MKPSSGCLVEEMEKELELCEVLCQLGLLVVESRQPELSTKGRMEGPHCYTKLKPHTCNSHNDLCKKKDLIEKEILSLWKNKVPICIEVLLLPPCQHGSYMASMPDISINSIKGKCLLLEQWRIQEVHKRPSESVVSLHSLFQAVKSYLYFSQLSAWLNQSHGNLPANVAYRICPPGDFCTNTFHRTPEIHHFPLSSKVHTGSVGLYVTVSTLPRQEVPVIPCPGLHGGDKVLQGGASNFVESDVEQDLKLQQDESSLNLSDSRPRRFRTSSYCADSDYAISLIPQVVSNSDTSSSSPKQCEFNEALQASSAEESSVEDILLDHDKDFKSDSNNIPSHNKIANDQTLINPSTALQSIKKDKLDVALPTKASKVANQANVLDVASTNNIKESSKPSAFNLLDDNNDDQDNGVIFYTPSDWINDQNTSDSNKETTTYNNTKLESLAQGSSSPLFNEPKAELKTYPSYHLPRFSPEFENGSSDGECSFAEIDNILSQALDTQLSLDSSLNGIPVYSKVYNSQCSSTNVHTSLANANSHHQPVSDSSQINYQNKNSTSQRFLPENFHKVTRPDKLRIKDNSNSISLRDSNHEKPVTDNVNNAKFECSITTPSTPNKSSNMPKRCYPSAPEKLSAMALVTPHRPRAPSLLKAVMGKETAAVKDQVINGNAVPNEEEKKTFRRNLCRSAAAVFNSSTGLPLQSSPAPIKKKSRLSFDYDEDLVTVKGIKNSLSCVNLDEFQDREGETEPKKKFYSTSAPASTNCLLGNFEESMLNGRLEPSGVVHGFTVDIGASGEFCPPHITLPLTAFFFELSEDNAPSPYLGHANLESVGKRGYHVPKQGTIQVTLFNPNKTVVKMFVVMYDLRDMPASCQTFLRQRTLYIPVKESPSDTEDAPVYLRYLIHLRFASSKSKKIYLHSDIRVIFARDKFEFDSRIANYELRSFTEKPVNPTFSPKR